MDFNFSQILQHPYASMALTYLGFGLTTGVVAKVILPGSENMGWIRTIMVGILGCFLGSAISSYLGYGSFGMDWTIPSFAAAVGGALVLLLINRLVTKT